MTKSELKQKLEAVRSKLCAHHGNTFLVGAGYDQLLPLLLDAYEALQAGASETRECGRNSYSCCGKCSPIYECEEAIARIEAFATQGAHEQSEFENGEK